MKEETSVLRPKPQKLVKRTEKGKGKRRGEGEREGELRLRTHYVHEIRDEIRRRERIRRRRKD